MSIVQLLQWLHGNKQLYSTFSSVDKIPEKSLIFTANPLKEGYKVVKSSMSPLVCPFAWYVISRIVKYVYAPHPLNNKNCV